jgi:hypothetical protein
VPLGPDTALLAVPALVSLDTAAATAPGAAPGALRLSPAPGAAGSVHAVTTWSVIPGRAGTAPDSVRLLWSTGSSGVEARLARAGTGLRGVASTFWDSNRPLQHSTVRASRIRCP